MSQFKVSRIVVFMVVVGVGVLPAVAGTLFCAVDWQRHFTHIDSDEGQVPPTRSDLPRNLQALAYSPSRTLYLGSGASSQGTLYTMNPRTGDTTQVVSTTTSIRGMACSGTGVLYVTVGTATIFQQQLRILDPSTGTYTDIGALWGDSTAAQGLAFSPNGHLYGISPYSSVISPGYALYTIDVVSARMQRVASFQGTDLSQGIAFTPSGELYGVGKNFARLDPATGAVIGEVYTLPYQYRAIEVVPEPASLLLLAVAGLFCLRRSV
jgi:WD40 repeat protein